MPKWKGIISKHKYSIWIKFEAVINGLQDLAKNVLKHICTQPRKTSLFSLIIGNPVIH